MASIIPPELFGLYGLGQGIGQLGQSLGQGFAQRQHRKRLDEQQAQAARQQDISELLTQMAISGINPQTTAEFQNLFSTTAEPLPNIEQMVSRTRADAIQRVQQGTATPADQVIYNQALHGSPMSADQLSRVAGAQVEDIELQPELTRTRLETGRIGNRISQMDVADRTNVRSALTAMAPHLGLDIPGVEGMGIATAHQIMSSMREEGRADERLQIDWARLGLDERRTRMQLRLWNKELERLEEEEDPAAKARWQAAITAAAANPAIDPTAVYKLWSGQELNELERQNVNEHYLPMRETTKAEVRARHIKAMGESNPASQRFEILQALYQSELIDDDTFNEGASSYLQNLFGGEISTKPTGLFGLGSPVLTIATEALSPEAMATPIRPDLATIGAQEAQGIAAVLHQEGGITEQQLEVLKGRVQNWQDIVAGVDALKAQEVVEAANQNAETDDPLGGLPEVQKDKTEPAPTASEPRQKTREEFEAEVEELQEERDAILAEVKRLKAEGPPPGPRANVIKHQQEIRRLAREYHAAQEAYLRKIRSGYRKVDK